MKEALCRFHLTKICFSLHTCKCIELISYKTLEGLKLALFTSMDLCLQSTAFVGVLLCDSCCRLGE